MHLLRPLIALALVGVLVACASQEAPRDDVPPADTQQSIPASFVVSTNEPFWQARVQAGTVELVGPDQKRSFKVESNEAVLDGRVVTARDAAGALELRVTERLCMDSMSGQEFAYTGKLSLDGEPPILGCGKPL